MRCVRLYRHSKISALWLALLFVLTNLPTVAPVRAQRRAPRPAPAGFVRPRLVLLIAVDQFRYDYLERFEELYGADGLRRLQQRGASWTNANYDHIPTYTAPGHATMLTGAYPAETGIIANEWVDTEKGKHVSSVSDDETQLLGGEANATGSSPRRLMASTVGDELKFVTNGRSKVIGISVKDRAAILPAGRRADAAYWTSSRTGTFVSSTYYFAGKQLPAWVEKFNAGGAAKNYCGREWTRLLPESEYLKRAGADDAAWERVAANQSYSTTFPHLLPAAKANNDFRQCFDELDFTPYSNDMLLDFAKQAMVNENLGADADTDLLSVSFSANDYVGHRYGPYSHEAMDISLRVDRTIGELLNYVDARVGLNNTLVIFTADHGVAPNPEQAALLNLPGGRISARGLLSTIRAALNARYPKAQRKAAGGDLVLNDYIRTYRNGERDIEIFENENLYLNYTALARDGVSAEEAERTACAAAMSVPGIRRCFTRTQLESRAVSPADDLARRALHGFYPPRSGDIVIIPDPYKYVTDGRTVATHGSPYSYDTHVPVIIMGRGVQPGRYNVAASVTDIAPTISDILKIQSPSNSVGRTLTEGLRE